MIVSGIDCRYGTLLLAHLCLAISLVSFVNAGRRGITFVLVYIRLYLAVVCLLGISKLLRIKLREHLKVVICAGDCSALRERVFVFCFERM